MKIFPDKTLFAFLNKMTQLWHQLQHTFNIKLNFESVLKTDLSKRAKVEADIL